MTLYEAMSNKSFYSLFILDFHYQLAGVRRSLVDVCQKSLYFKLTPPPKQLVWLDGLEHHEKGRIWLSAWGVYESGAC